MKLTKFLSQLDKNNNREWFNAHRDEYDELRQQWYDNLDRMIAAMTSWEPAFATLTGKRASYRIYRDVRFSQDKTPYKPYFSAVFSQYPKSLSIAQYYLHAGAVGQESMTAGGIWCPEAAQLKKLRHAIVDNIEEFREIINNPAFLKLYPGWYGHQLKTAPKGWPKDHPDIDLLRLTQYGRWHELPSSFFDSRDWPEEAAHMFEPLKPFIDFINYSLMEE